MLIWLDSTINRKAKPNENYAREVMELFTPRPRPLHREGHPGGRAGVHRLVRRSATEFEEVPRQHDDGPKTVLGQTGTGRGDDIPAILLEQPACAEFICRQAVPLLRERDRRALRGAARTAGRRRSASRATRSQVPVAMILRSNLFFDAEHAAAAGQVPGRVRGRDDPVAGDPQADGRRPPRWPRPASGWARASMRRPSVAGWDWRAGLDQLDHHAGPGQPGPGLLSDDDEALGRRCNPAKLAAGTASDRPAQGRPGSCSTCWCPGRSSRQCTAADRQGRDGEGRRWRCGPARRGATYPDLARVSTGLTDRPRSTAMPTTFHPEEISDDFEPPPLPEHLARLQHPGRDGRDDDPRLPGPLGPGGAEPASPTSGSSWSCSSWAAMTG